MGDRKWEEYLCDMQHDLGGATDIVDRVSALLEDGKREEALEVLSKFSEWTNSAEDAMWSLAFSLLRREAASQ